MRGASRPHSGGALLVGRLLAAAFFFVDGAYKLSGTAWPSYRQFMFDSFKALGVYFSSDLADVQRFCSAYRGRGRWAARLGGETGALILCFY